MAPCDAKDRIRQLEAELHKLAWNTDPHYRGAGKQPAADWIYKQWSNRWDFQEQQIAKLEAEVAKQRDLLCRGHRIMLEYANEYVEVTEWLVDSQWVVDSQPKETGNG